MRIEEVEGIGPADAGQHARAGHVGTGAQLPLGATAVGRTRLETVPGVSDPVVGH